MNKKIITLLVLLLSIVTFQNCQKDKLFYKPLKSEKNEFHYDIKKVTKSFFELNPTDFSVAFNSLTNDEIRSIWLQHIDEFVTIRELDSSQISMVEILKSFISNANLDNYNEINNFVSVWLPNALDVFSEEEVFLLAFTLYNDVDDAYEALINNPGGGTTTGNPPKPCNYETSSFIFACALHPNQCETKECINSLKG